MTHELYVAKTPVGSAYIACRCGYGHVITETDVEAHIVGAYLNIGGNGVGGELRSAPVEGSMKQTADDTELVAA